MGTSMTKNRAAECSYKQMKGGIQIDKMENMSLKFGALLLMGLLFVGVMPLAEAGIRDENREARAKYASAKADFSKMKNAYIQARQDFLAAREKYGNKNSATLEGARDYMMKANKVTIAHLEKMKSFVEADWALEQSEKDAIVAEIERDITWLENKQSEIETADREGLIAIGKEIKSYWNNVKIDLKKYTGKILNARALWVLEQADKAENVVVRNIEKAEANGKDVTELNDFLDDFRAKKALAEEEYDKARNSFSQISSLQDADRLFREGNAFLRQGNRYIKESYGILRDIHQELTQ